MKSLAPQRSPAARHPDHTSAGSEHESDVYDGATLLPICGAPDRRALALPPRTPDGPVLRTSA